MENGNGMAREIREKQEGEGRTDNTKKFWRKAQPRGRNGELVEKQENRKNELAQQKKAARKRKRHVKDANFTFKQHNRGTEREVGYLTERKNIPVTKTETSMKGHGGVGEKKSQTNKRLLSGGREENEIQNAQCESKKKKEGPEMENWSSAGGGATITHMKSSHDKNNLQLWSNT